MQRSGEGGDRARDGAVDVGERRGDDPGRERRSVELVVGVEDERHVERPDHLGLGDFPRQQVQRVGGEGEPAPRREGLLAGAQALEGAEHGRQLGDEPHRLAVLGRPAVVAAVGVYEDCGADGGAQHVHRVRPGRRVLDDAQHHAIELL